MLKYVILAKYVVILGISLFYLLMPIAKSSLSIIQLKKKVGLILPILYPMNMKKPIIN